MIPGAMRLTASLAWQSQDRVVTSLAFQSPHRLTTSLALKSHDYSSQDCKQEDDQGQCRRKYELRGEVRFLDAVQVQNAKHVERGNLHDSYHAVKWPGIMGAAAKLITSLKLDDDLYCDKDHYDVVLKPFDLQSIISVPREEFLTKYRTQQK